MTAWPWFSLRAARCVLGVAVACGLLAGGAVRAVGYLSVPSRPQITGEHVGARPGILAGWSVTGPVPRGRHVLAARIIPVTPPRQAARRVLAVPAVTVSRKAPALGGCAFWNISCQVDAWFAGLIVSAISPLLSVVGQTALATPQVTGMPAVRAMSAGSLGVADSIFTLLLLAGGMLLMGYQTFQTSYTIKEVAPRAVAGFVFANSSLLVIPKAIDLSNGITGALAPGTSPASAATTLTHMLMNGEPGSGIFLILLSGVAVVLAVVIAVTYIIRMMALVLLAAVAPLALAGYTLPQTAWTARWWWRAFTAALAIPAAQALVLTAAVKVFFSPGWTGWKSNPQLINILITICLLYVIMRIPFWLARPALAGFGSGPVRAGLRFALSAAVLSRAGRMLRGAPARRSPAPSPAGGPARRSPIPSPPGGPARRGPIPPLPGTSTPPRPVPPLPGGGSGYIARHARPPSLPAGEDRPGQIPPLPAGENQSRTAPPLPGRPARRNLTPPLPGGPVRRSPIPPLPGGAARRGPVPPLPGAAARHRPAPPLPGTTSPRQVPPLPASPASPPERTSPPPLPGAPPRRSPAPPLPGGSARRTAAPPLPGGPARRSPIPPLPGSRYQAAAPPQLPSESMRRTGRHQAPPPLPADGTGQRPRPAHAPPAQSGPTSRAAQDTLPPTAPPTAAAGQPGAGPAQQQRRRRGRPGRNRRPVRRREDPR
jgi:hypothetical protein